MSLKALTGALQPPVSPIDPGIGDDWREVEQKMGTTLPEDYKEFIKLYGTGQIAGFLWIFNPFSRNPNLNLIAQMAQRLDAHRSFRTKFPETVPFALYPEAGGLLPCGASDNGDVLFWETNGQPNQWRIVIADSRCEMHERFDQNLADVLAAFLSGSTVSMIVSEDLHAADAAFAPFPEFPFRPTRNAPGIMAMVGTDLTANNRDMSLS